MSIQPEAIDRVFAPGLQKDYIKDFQKRGGLTRRRSECFVRLWGYLLWKYQSTITESDAPLQITELELVPEFISCTHREAAVLFYPDAERGSDRSAGLMMDKLVALGLLDKQFDGQTQCWKVREQPEMVLVEDEVAPNVIADYFNPITDSVQAGRLMTRAFSELVRDASATAYKITKSLRKWGKIYAPCIRVLRREDTQNPVGVIVLYPTAEKSEQLFFDSPSKGFYMTNDREDDPFEMAHPGDETCTCIYVRAWLIDQEYLNAETMQLLIETTQATLREMREDYPALCDIYSLIIHPSYEQLRRIMGFEKTVQDSQRSYTWVYLAIDRYIALDAASTVVALTAGLPSTQKGR
ncbi:hypothetical protein IQ266_24730 [filamentous cyanobacterium LEGE 11480]|uniref:Uncharacterized protein n=1 Tax=Romeriopsis navalis LEGE 11480 TaxID=2777977 RepID=A0A928VQR8_9CYAN|nr:hypothetical protein [Romeriopsis navalis]MBE9032946.1 hypothetical protein [Romeriopsis navalis LEGE 11480]